MLAFLVGLLICCTIVAIPALRYAALVLFGAGAICVGAIVLFYYINMPPPDLAAAAARTVKEKELRAWDCQQDYVRFQWDHSGEFAITSPPDSPCDTNPYALN